MFYDCFHTCFNNSTSINVCLNYSMYSYESHPFGNYKFLTYFDNLWRKGI